MATRQLDPLFGGLARAARQLNLPVKVFVAWLIISAFGFVIVNAFTNIVLAVLCVAGLYAFLSILTRHEDKGVLFFFKSLIRNLTNNKKHFGGISYEPNKKDVKGLDFEFKAVALGEKLERSKIPYLYHQSQNVIKLQSGDLITCVKMKGLNFETEAYSDLALLKQYRNNMLMQFGSRFGMYVHYIRKRTPIAEYRNIKNPVANRFLARYSHIINQKKRFTNDIYVTLLIRADDPSLTAFERMFGAADKDADKLEKELDTAASILMSQLDRAEPTRLTIKEIECNAATFKYCETSTFLSYLLNLDDSPIPVYGEEIRDYLSYTRKIFRKDGTIQFNCANGTPRVASVFGIPTNAYPAGTDHQMLDAFLEIPHELVISMSFLLMDRSASAKLAKDQQAFLTITDDDSVSQTLDIHQVRDDIASGKLLNGLFNWNVMVHATTGEEYKKGIEAVRKAFATSNFIPKREDVIAEPAYYGMLPGNYHMESRAGIINTLNFAGFASLHNTKVGKKHGNHWHDFTENRTYGDYVLELTSVSNTPYYFNFHNGDVGHTRVIALTGGGKTTLINALLAGAARFDPYIFHFDFLHSAAPFMRSMGGKHQTIVPNLATGWNPLKLPDSPENRAFLYDLLSLLTAKKDSQGQNIPLTARESKTVHAVIEQVYTLKPELRRLCHVLPLFGIEEEDNLAERLGKWVNDGAYASIFDNENDSFTIEGAKLFCFEMKHIIDSAELLPAVIMYIAHRIDQAMTRREPFIIVFEEGQRLIQNPIMLRWLKNLLTTVRRRNGMIVYITPTPEVLTKDDDLRQQFKTSIFFPNPKGSHKTYCEEGGLGCTEKEYEFLTTEDPKNRKFLIKTDHDSVISSLDLGDMMEFVQLFSGNDEKNGYIDQLVAEIGNEEPSTWLPQFNQRYH